MADWMVIKNVDNIIQSSQFALFICVYLTLKFENVYYMIFKKITSQAGFIQYF